MFLGYIDEAGDLGEVAATPRPNDQPVFALGMLFFEQARLQTLTADLLQLKRNFFPGLIPPASHFLDAVLKEVKGADLRRNIALGSRNQVRQSIRFLDEAIGLCERADARLLCRVLIKNPGAPVQATKVYSASCQWLVRSYDHFLGAAAAQGIAIADSRTHGLNVSTAHSLFTQMFSFKGAAYPRLLEVPTFGHSENHAGVQLCDLILSGLIVPIAALTYCSASVRNVHVQPGYSKIQIEFAARLRALQYRFQSSDGRWTGGITVNDQIAQRSSSALFR